MITIPPNAKPWAAAANPTVDKMWGYDVAFGRAKPAPTPIGKGESWTKVAGDRWKAHLADEDAAAK